MSPPDIPLACHAFHGGAVILGALPAPDPARRG
jgi:hypothetical protein